MASLAPELFALDPCIRYVAVNQAGKVREMAQNPKWPSHNPAASDEFEELVVNPVVLQLTRYRGELDLDGIRWVVIRYGPQYQLLFPYREGHVSVGLELEADVAATSKKIAQYLGLRI